MQLESKFTTQWDSYLHKTLSEYLDDNSKQLLDMLIESVYLKGRRDLAKELRPKKVIKYGIFTGDIEKGIKLIDELTADKIVITVKKARQDYFVECIDSEYRILNFSQNSRGNKMHYAYVDNQLLESEQEFEILNYVVKPCLTPAYMLYENGEKCLLDDHLLYF